jgi:hypothetical protein
MFGMLSVAGAGHARPTALRRSREDVQLDLLHCYWDADNAAAQDEDCDDDLDEVEGSVLSLIGKARPGNEYGIQR